MATYKEAQSFKSEYLGAESSGGSEVRQVVTHRNSLVLLPFCCMGRYIVLRYVAISSRVRWSRGVSIASDVDGAMKAGSCQGNVSIGDSCGESG